MILSIPPKIQEIVQRDTTKNAGILNIIRAGIKKKKNSELSSTANCFGSFLHP